MSVPIESLPPWAQRQAIQKLAEQKKQRPGDLAKQARRAGIPLPMLEKLEEQRRGAPLPAQETERVKAAKYHNVRDARETESGETLRFDSRKEARRYDELMVLLRAGEIEELKLQPEFTIQEAFTTPEGNRVRAIRYRADFSYVRKDGKKVVEDVKSKATKTREYQNKKKLVAERFGVWIREV